MSASPRSTFFKLILRLASLLIMISPRAWILNWSSAVSLISSFSRTISALLPLKSIRLASSFLAWLTAFSISIELTCETISKEGMPGIVYLAKLWKQVKRMSLSNGFSDGGRRGQSCTFFTNTDSKKVQDRPRRPGTSRIHMDNFRWGEAIEPCRRSAAVGADILRVNQVFDLQFRQFFRERNGVQR